jgi:hypothetical protein
LDYPGEPRSRLPSFFSGEDSTFTTRRLGEATEEVNLAKKAGTADTNFRRFNVQTGEVVDLPTHAP